MFVFCLAEEEQANSSGQKPEEWCAPPGHPLTEVDVVVSTSLTVHMIEEEAGERFQDEAEDGHTHAEAVYVCWDRRVKYCEVDDVDHYRQQQPNQELKSKKLGKKLGKNLCSLTSELKGKEILDKEK